VNIYDHGPTGLRPGRDRQLREGLAHAKAGGKWNTYEITPGLQLTVVLNGVRP